jgi:DNA-binding NarL/FixJ family response regulator
MSALEDDWPDEDRRNGALDAFLNDVLDPDRLPRPLTEAETVTLRLYSHGMTRAMVADQLCLSTQAIKSRTKNAREKLGAKTTAEACCEAVRRGLIP